MHLATLHHSSLDCRSQSQLIPQVFEEAWMVLPEVFDNIRYVRSKEPCS